ncbi:MAG: alpha-ketoacid dehydrogenase subunit beta [Deltaproteobacteria bacterium]|nr:alpha-ketoacid dehydrogenase subunit beta [Deltaproteobacteria bacterium]MBW2154746.1 alpha-ketoacid dehydrogenase subunit beta [Deltaproteobacteria bacterium]
MRTITVLEAIREAISEEMASDTNVFMIGEDIGQFGGALGQTKGLLEKFGEDRIIDTPISEAAIVGAAVGASMLGMRPIADIMFTDFSTIAMDQIINQAAKAKFMSGGKVSVPIVIRMQGGAGRGKAAQHSQSFEAIFSHIPGLKVVMPSTPYDAKGLLKTAIRDNDPVVFIEHGSLYKIKGGIPDEEFTIPLGVGEIKRAGSDISVITYSYMVHTALAAAEVLAEEGIYAEVVDLRTLRPMDTAMIMESVKKTHRVVVLHEACVTCGFGGEIVARIAENVFDYIDAPIKRLGVPDVPIPYAKSLENTILPDAEKLITCIKNILDGL